MRHTTSLAPARASATIALRFSLSSKATTRGGRLNSMHPQDYRDSAREAALNMFDWRAPLGKSEWPMAAAKQLKAAILARGASKGRRGRRTRPGPRQYTVADLERARDRVEAERRSDNDHTSNPDRGRAGLVRAQLELHIIESQLRSRGLLEC